MAVRFLPPPEERAKPQREDRENLAEVIEFRSRLRRPEAVEVQDASNDPDTGGIAAQSEASPAPAVQSKWAGGGLRLIGGSMGSEPEPEPEREPEPGREAEAELEPVAGGLTAHQSAVKLLARKPLSSGELLRALVVIGHPEFDAEEAVAECEAALYIDDEDLARSVTRKLRESKGESRSRIKQKLRDRHLPDAVIEAALEELDDDDELVLLRQTAADRAKRMAGLDRQTAERRLLGFLARRGWSGERATRAVRDALDGGSLGGSLGGSSRGGHKGSSGGGVRFQ